MDRIQVLLNTLSSSFLLVASLAALYNFYKENSFRWLFTGIVFLLASVNKIFDFDNRIVGRWLLSSGIGFINYINKVLPWLKLYKQPGFVVDFVFLILGAVIILLLWKILKDKSLSFSSFLIGIISSLIVVILGFNLAVLKYDSLHIVIYQLSKDSFEVIGSLGLFISFLTYFGH